MRHFLNKKQGTTTKTEFFLCKVLLKETETQLLPINIHQCSFHISFHSCSVCDKCDCKGAGRRHTVVKSIQDEILFDPPD